MQQFFLVAQLLSVGAFRVQALTEGDYTYTTNSVGLATITDFNTAYAGELHITNSLGGCPVVAIAKGAFSSCSGLTSATIPGSVTSVVAEPFLYCNNLTNISVVSDNPVFSSFEGVMFDKNGQTLLYYPGGKVGSYVVPADVSTIAAYAFYRCPRPPSITIGESVTSIGERAFSYCSGLSNITVSASNPVYCSVDGVLLNKAMTVIVKHPEQRPGSYLITNSVTRIEKAAFEGCSRINQVTMPNGVTNIGEMAFRACSLTNLYIPASVSRIETAAFIQSSLRAFYFHGNAPGLGSSVFDTGTVYRLSTAAGWPTVPDPWGGRPTALWGTSVYYVDASRADDTGVGTSWATAKKTIQAAVNLTVNGDTVLVTNGVYNSGTTVTPGYALSNRVSITNSILVKSVDGPDVTFIEGAGTNYFSTALAVRCVYMYAGTLSGFTLRYGATTNYVSVGRRPEHTGGGVYMERWSPNPMLVTNCIIKYCKAYYGGGAGWGTLRNCRVEGNLSPYWGAGVSDSTVYNSVLLGNQSSSYGGGAASCALNNCLITGNYSGTSGGGAIRCTMNNCTVVKNTSGGSGVEEGTLSNCILWENRKRDNTLYNFSISTGNNTCAIPLLDGTNNIVEDPLFVNGTTGDFSLRSDSPCVNTGSNGYVVGSTDLNGNPRIQYGTVDMGAYEYAGPVVYRLIVNGGGGSGFYTNGQQVAIVSDTPADGYAFYGWTGATQYIATVTASNTTVTMPGQDITVTATYAGKSYTVAFNAQGGSVPSPAAKTVTYGSAYGSLASVTRPLYEFVGWYTDSGYTGSAIATNTTVTIPSDHTLYAKWTELLTSWSPVPVPYVWLSQYPLLLQVAGGNYEVAALIDTDLDGHLAWEEYVAGTVPTDKGSVFWSGIEIVDAVPRVTWTPDLGTARVYTVQGKTNLTDAAWGPTNAGSRYFKVRVEMP